MEENLVLKRGYLNDEFKLFYIKDNLNDEFQFHFHEFNKIIIFIRGNVIYNIEGKSYKLKPWDILIINSHQVHKPIIESDDTYERIILWVNSDFLLLHSDSSSDLLQCFHSAESNKCNLLRVPNNNFKDFQELVVKLKESYFDILNFGSKLLSKTLFLQFIIYINRLILLNLNANYVDDIDYDESIQVILSYISENLSENLSIETLSNIFFISKYYLMHKFKKETGYTLHNYILQKRLMKASDLLKLGISPSVTCYKCGFNDYSNFVKAFKKLYKVSPQKYTNPINKT